MAHGDEPVPDDDDNDDAHDDRPKRKIRRAAKCGDRTKTRETRGRADVDKGKGKAREANRPGETMPNQPQEAQYRTPSPPSQSSAVKALCAKVLFRRLLCGLRRSPLLGHWRSQIRPSFGQTRSPSAHPFKNGTRFWRVFYKQPKQWARFCSFDWSTYFYWFPLWMPSYK